jgi:hypothetical protein
MSGLLMRSRSSLAMIISAHQVSHQLHALKALVGVRNALICGSPGVHHLTSHWPTSTPSLAKLLRLSAAMSLRLQHSSGKVHLSS